MIMIIIIYGSNTSTLFTLILYQKESYMILLCYLCSKKEDFETSQNPTKQLEVHNDDPNPKRKKVEEQICIDRLIKNECFIDMGRFAKQLLQAAMIRTYKRTYL